MTSIEDELNQITNDINPSVLTPIKRQSEMDELKEMLLAFKTANPRMFDSTKVFEHLLTLVDTRLIADDKITMLTGQIEALEQKSHDLQLSFDTLIKVNKALTDRISLNDSLMHQFKERAVSALLAVEQYLRTHP